MPKFTTYRGMGPGKLIQEVKDNLHISGRVYRTSDLSEIVGKPALPAFHGGFAGSTSYTLRLKRGFMGGSRAKGSNRQSQFILADFDNALCGVWSGVTSAGVLVDNTTFRQFNTAKLGTTITSTVVDSDIETGVVRDVYNMAPFGDNDSSECAVFLPPGPAGTLAMYRDHTGSGACSTVETYPAGSAVNTYPAQVMGSRTVSATMQWFHYRINDNPQRWYFMSVQGGPNQHATLEVRSVVKSTLAAISHISNLAIPATATPLTTAAMGYCNSIPSYATVSGVNELSSYIAYRHATGVEIHRVQLAGTDAVATVTNNLVALDDNQMGVMGTNANSYTCIRTQLVNHIDGNKYLLVMGFEPESTTVSTPSMCMMHVYKLTSKDAAQYVASYNLAPGPRAYLGADDSNLRFTMVYDDRYEFWAFGVGGTLSKVDTLYIQRLVSAQNYTGSPYGYDNTGRFWYIVPESPKPNTYNELALHFYSPPGQVNTISVTFDSDNYTYSGAPVNGVLTVSVKDITGAFIAAVVNLSPTVNLSLSSTQVQTTTDGPTLVPFTVNAPGDLAVDAWT